MGQSDSSKKKTYRRAFYAREDQRRRAAYAEDPKICPECGKVIPFEKRRNKFCSQSCSTRRANYGRVRVEIKHDRECAHCGKIKETLQNKYCDDCIADGVYNRAMSLDVCKSDRTRRFFLLRERGHRCEVCGLEEWCGQPIPIELDHIDGDADNNTTENLRLICPNCHAQTDTYKGANAGKDSSRQKKRRRRYRDGKTY